MNKVFKGAVLSLGLVIAGCGDVGSGRSTESEVLEDAFAGSVLVVTDNTPVSNNWVMDAKGQIGISRVTGEVFMLKSGKFSLVSDKLDDKTVTNTTTTITLSPIL